MGYVLILLFLVGYCITDQANGCPSVCQCGSNTVTCSNLKFDKFDEDVSGLKLVSNDPLTLGERIFKKMGLDKMSYLRIENTTIDKIHPKAFDGLKSLTQISIVNCKLPSLEQLDTMSLSNSLRKLVFQKTEVKGFEKMNLQSLEELELTHCNITELQKDAFANMSELSYINLSNNRLTTFDASIFTKLKNLIDLQLSHNKITDIPDGIFTNETELSVLNLSHNPITKVDVKSESSIEELTLKSCQIKNFYGGQYLIMVASLDLSDNQISSLSVDTFKMMGDLEYLDLSSNKLENLDSKLFYNNPRLFKITLDNNNLRNLPKLITIDGNFQTFYFSCNNCLLSDIKEDTFENFPGVVALKLANNNLKNIGENLFSSLPNLIELDLSNNIISEFKPNTFKHNSALRVLVFSGNFLKYIDADLFSKNGVLHNLDVSNNQLQQIWKQTNVTLPSLKFLNLANNKITHLTKKDLEVANSLDVLDVTNLHLECTQDLKEAIQWLTDRNVASMIAMKKTHESLQQDAEEIEVTVQTWENIARAYCEDSYEFDDEEDDDEEEDDETSKDIPIIYVPKTTTEETIIEDDSTEGDELDDTYDMFDNVRMVGKMYNQNQRSYVVPVLVFLFTSLVVLILSAVIILLFLRRRGSRTGHSITLSHIQILPWSNSPNIKKHSGSVYKPLSEEILVPPTQKSHRYEQVPTATVHNS